MVSGERWDNHEAHPRKARGNSSTNLLRGSTGSQPASLASRSDSASTCEPYATTRGTGEHVVRKNAISSPSFRPELPRSTMMHRGVCCAASFSRISTLRPV